MGALKKLAEANTENGKLVLSHIHISPKFFSFFKVLSVIRFKKTAFDVDTVCLTLMSHYTFSTVIINNWSSRVS